MPMTPERVLARLNAATMGLDKFKRKVYKLRQIVAGDLSGLSSGPGSTSTDDEQKRARQFKQEWRDILVTEFEEARDNSILKAVKTLVMQTNYSSRDRDQGS